MPGKTRDCTLAQNIMFKYKLVGFEFYDAMPNELSLLLTPAICTTIGCCARLVFHGRARPGVENRNVVLCNPGPVIR